MEKISKEQYNILLNSDNKTEKFTLSNRILYAKVVDVYDGDTCKVNLFINNNDLEPKQFTIRMNGYDCPEIKTKNLIEKKCATISKQILSNLILNKIVKLECLEFDKYGRVLGNIYIINNNDKELNVNEYMINQKLGYNYGGGTKKDFDTLYNEKYYDDNKNIDNIITKSYE